MGVSKQSASVSGIAQSREYLTALLKEITRLSGKTYQATWVELVALSASDARHHHLGVRRYPSAMVARPSSIRSLERSIHSGAMCRCLKTAQPQVHPRSTRHHQADYQAITTHARQDDSNAHRRGSGNACTSRGVLGDNVLTTCIADVAARACMPTYLCVASAAW